ncbi:MAG: ABC transporter substrate-binding protein [Rhodospirillaceae bacterium]|nr:ABC transporter substrate-binding protein [Rhodospirillaceae bacterium]
MLHQNKLLKLLAVPVLAVGTLIATAPAQTVAAKDITYLLPAPGFLPAFAPWMLALGNGYYKAEGLNVKFQTARGGVDVAKQVGAGNAVVGGGLGDTPIIVRPNGIPVKAVAVLGGRSLMQLVTRNDRGIKTLKDLKGKTITALSLQDTTYYALLGMLATAGLTKNDVKAQAAGPVGVWKLFLAGKADAMAAVPDWIGIAYGAGIKFKIWPADDHFKSMAQAILAADKTIKDNPQLIGKLVRATLKGMKDIMKDPDAASVAYVKAVPKHKGKEKQMASVFKLYNKFVYPGQKTVGEMDRARLKGLQDFYVNQGILRKSSKLDDLYTNQFVK